MPQIEITDEREESGRWRFTAQVLDDAGALHRVDLTLAWSDYNLWSPSGSDAPEAVAAAVLRCLLAERGTDTLPARLDASMVRRLVPGADETITRLIS